MAVRGRRGVTRLFDLTPRLLIELGSAVELRNWWDRKTYYAARTRPIVNAAA